jgi:hypothetical protein
VVVRTVSFMLSTSHLLPEAWRTFVMSSGCGHNILGPRLTVAVRDERMDVWMIEAAMAAAALVSQC